jgi:hypothetical protein
MFHETRCSNRASAAGIPQESDFYIKMGFGGARKWGASLAGNAMNWRNRLAFG